MSTDEFIVADSSQVEKTIELLARRISAAFGPTLTLIGIRRRGVPIAEKLARALGDSGKVEVDLAEMRLKRYADDCPSSMNIRNRRSRICPSTSKDTPSFSSTTSLSRAEPC